ncbi:MAG: hypothetical protein ABI587_02150 [Gemmatimonadales bacterium]
MPVRRATSTRLPRRWLLAIAALGLGASACRPAGARELQVVGTDYGFTVASKVPFGPVAIRFVNQGKVPHEMALGRLRAGMTADSVLARLSQGRDPSEVTDGVVGILIVEPGQSSMGTLQTELLAGRTYMMICQFRDADSLPPHIAMGMQASFTVD